MFRITRSSSLCLTVVAAVLSIICEGCGSSSSSAGMSNNSMSQVQAQAVANQVSQAMALALEGASAFTAPATSAPPSLPAAVRSVRPDATSGCTPIANGENCDWPISLMNTPCGGAQGGTISVTGDIDGTLNNSGAGSLSGQFTITPANCSVSNLIVNGDPSISVAGQINFTDNETPTFPIIFTETGGISYGPTPSGSCQVNTKYTITSLTSCTISGTVCGQSVSGNC
jgi:hypothetical protein